MVSVFEMLLGFGNEGNPEHLKKVNDYTVEGATVLMNKIGNLFDSKLAGLK